MVTTEIVIIVIVGARNWSLTLCHKSCNQIDFQSVQLNVDVGIGVIIKVIAEPQN